MRVAGRRLTRGELALVAAALGVPVPLVALSGYVAALPDALGRGLGSLVTLAGDGRADGGVRRDALAGTDSNGPSVERAAPPGRGSAPAQGAGPVAARADAKSASPEASDPGTEAAPGEGPPEGEGPVGDTGGSDTGGTALPSGGNSPADGSGSTTFGDIPGLSVTIGVPGTSAGATAGIGGASGDPGSDSADATSVDSSRATLELTDTGGASTEVGIDGSGGTVLP